MVYKLTGIAMSKKRIDKSLEIVRSLISNRKMDEAAKQLVHTIDIALDSWDEELFEPREFEDTIYRLAVITEEIALKPKRESLIWLVYFTKIIPNALLIIMLYLKNHGFRVRFIQFDELEITNNINFDKQNPDIVVASLFLPQDINKLATLENALRKTGIKLFAGGYQFIYDQSIQKLFNYCKFPKNLSDMIRIIDIRAKHLK